MTHSFPTTLIHIACKGGEGGKNDKFSDPQRASSCPFHVTSFRLDNKSLREVIACQNSTRVMGLVGDEWQMSRRVISIYYQLLMMVMMAV